MLWCPFLQMFQIIFSLLLNLQHVLSFLGSFPLHIFHNLITLLYLQNLFQMFIHITALCTEDNPP